MDEKRLSKDLELTLLKYEQEDHKIYKLLLLK